MADYSLYKAKIFRNKIQLQRVGRPSAEKGWQHIMTYGQALCDHIEFKHNF